MESATSGLKTGRVWTVLRATRGSGVSAYVMRWVATERAIRCGRGVQRAEEGTG